jgi:ABC-type sugar transport system substrate-binding protein
MKKLIALLLALVMVFALVACGNPGGEQTGEPAPTGSQPADPNPGTEGPKTDSKGRYPAETIKIGFVNYDPTAEQYLALENYFDYLAENYNIEVMSSEALNSAEGEMAFIDACAAAGCKAIFGYYNVSNE